jgi:hypothetical protein
VKNSDEGLLDRDEWLAALGTASFQPFNDQAKTCRELAAMFQIGERKMRERLATLTQQDRVRVYRKMVTDVTGRSYPVPAYVLRKEK